LNSNNNYCDCKCKCDSWLDFNYFDDWVLPAGMFLGLLLGVGFVLFERWMLK
jgi:hypothetical protein